MSPGVIDRLDLGRRGEACWPESDLITAGFGIDGLFFGIGMSVLTASLFLAVRFAMLTRRHILPI